MRAGEIFLAEFPYGDIPVMKVRPVLLLTGLVGPIPEVLVAYISSVIPTRLLPSDLVLDPDKAEFSSTKLKCVSALRLHKLATIHSSSVSRRLGQLDAGQRSVVAGKLRALLAL
jgi:mRNA interferase MazF